MALAAQKIFELGQLRLDARPLDVLRRDGQRSQLRDLLTHHLADVVLPPARQASGPETASSRCLPAL